jgi:hypothetical protein
MPESPGPAQEASIAPESAESGANLRPDAAASGGVEVPVDERVETVLLVGDSVALSLLPAARASREVQVNIATRFGCGTAPFTAVAEGVVLEPEQPLCNEWDEARVREIAAQPADLGVLFLGPWELYDRWVDGDTVGVESEQWLRLSAESYQRVLGEMVPHVDSIAVIPNFCRGAPDVGLPVEAMYRSGRYAPVVNDKYRMMRANEALWRALDAMSLEVDIVDLGDYLCKAGYVPQLDGVELHTDGVHFTEQGGDLVWRYLERQLGLVR